jgi:hypothetical protein
MVEPILTVPVIAVVGSVPQLAVLTEYAALEDADDPVDADDALVPVSVFLLSLLHAATSSTAREKALRRLARRLFIR